MSLVPGSRFPSHPYQGPQYYPPKHMGAMHLSVLVYVNGTPAVVVKDVDDYGSLFSVNLAGGNVAGAAASGTGVVPQAGWYNYGSSIAAGAALGSIGFAGSPYSLVFGLTAYFGVTDTADTAAEKILMQPNGITAGYMLEGYVGAAAGAVEAFTGILGGYDLFAGGAGFSFPIANNNVATTANCTTTLYFLSIYMMDFVPGPGTAGQTW